MRFEVPECMDSTEHVLYDDHRDNPVGLAMESNVIAA